MACIRGGKQGVPVRIPLAPEKRPLKKKKNSDYIRNKYLCAHVCVVTSRCAPICRRGKVSRLTSPLWRACVVARKGSPVRIPPAPEKRPLKKKIKKHRHARKGIYFGHAHVCVVTSRCAPICRRGKVSRLTSPLWRACVVARKGSPLRIPPVPEKRPLKKKKKKKKSDYVRNKYLCAHVCVVTSRCAPICRRGKVSRLTSPLWRACVVARKGSPVRIPPAPEKRPLKKKKKKKSDYVRNKYLYAHVCVVTSRCVPICRRGKVSRLTSPLWCACVVARKGSPVRIPPAPEKRPLKKKKKNQTMSEINTFARMSVW